MSSQNKNISLKDAQTLHNADLPEVLLQIEAIIFASDSPVSLAHLKQAFDQRYTSSQLRQFLQQLAILQHSRAIELIETAQGFRFQVKSQYRPLIVKNNPVRQIKLSASLLEVLAVIAYHQPVTRSEIEQIRGVSNNAKVLSTLFDWNWIKESGYREVPGRPALLVSTPQFLNAFGIRNLSELPALTDKNDINQVFNTAEINEHKI